MFFSKNKSIVGVDIGTAFVKIAQVSGGQTPHLETYGLVNAAISLDANASSGSIIEASNIVKRLISEAGVTAKDCVVSLPNNAVFTSIIDMPALSDAELESAVAFEAKKYVPLPLSEVILSWSMVEKPPGSASSKVLLIAVPKQIQENYVKLFSTTGLNLSVIEIEALALIRALSPETKENSVIIDIGARSTGLNVVVGGVLQLTRSLNIGGDSITDTIAKTLQVSLPRAEQFKKDFGLSDAELVPETIKPIMDSIKHEIKQLVSIYAARSNPIKRLVIVGGGANLPKIKEFFGDLGVEVVFGNPVAAVTYDKAIQPIIERFSLQIPVAVGLAMHKIK